MSPREDGSRKANEKCEMRYGKWFLPADPESPTNEDSIVKLAHARSGDKGDTANVGLIALRDEIYPILVREVTASA